MGAINVIATILNLRAPGMTLMKMPLFVWTWLITAFLLIAVMPVLAGCVTMMLMDIHFGTSFFSAAGGGDPVLFQHVFWFFGHPEVYIMILPAFGAVSRSSRPSRASRCSATPRWSTPRRASRSCRSSSGRTTCSWSASAGGRAVLHVRHHADRRPTGVKVFNWVSTMWQGSLTFETPMLFAVAFVILFTIGGFSGLMLAHRPGGLPVPGHLLRGRALPLRAGAGGDLRHLRLGLLLAAEVDRAHVRRNPRQAAFLAVVHRHEHGLLPDALRRLAGMPRRIPDYNLQFADFNMVSSIGAFMFGATQIFFLFIVIKCIRGGAPARQPWDGAEAWSGRAVAGAIHLYHAAGSEMNTACGTPVGAGLPAMRHLNTASLHRWQAAPTGSGRGQSWLTRSR
jgi:cytochrome c oxidase subunit 1